MTLPIKKVQKSPKPKYNMWQCSGYMIGLAWHEKEKKVLVLCLLQALLTVISNLVSLYVSPAILSAVERQASYAELLTTILVFVILIMFCAAASSYVNSNVLYGRISVRCAIIAAINKKSCITSYPNTTDDQFIKLRSKSGQATQSNHEATEAIWGTLTSLLQNVIGFIIYMILILSLNFWLMLVILAASLIGYVVNKKLTGYGYRHREEEGDISGKLWYQIMQAKNYQAAKDIRIFGMKPWMEEISAKALAAFEAFHERANNIYIWGSILDLALAFVRNGFAYAYLIGLVLNRGLSVAQFLLYFSAVGGFSAWVGGILGSMTTLYRQSLDLSTVKEFLEYPEPFVFENGEKLSLPPNTQHEIRLENVFFKYPGAEKYTLENVNITIRPGEKIAVVGLNGAGKTTLVKLICGFFDPTQGTVFLDGKDIRAYNRRDYYALFSAVFQDFSLLAGTVAANVAQTEEKQNVSRIKECIEKAGLSEKINTLKDGYETYLNRCVYENGCELSGGETQRLMLARALYKQAPFIILDEPTAALDPIAEADMYNKYHEMTQGCTSVYISHRLASTRFCDRILLINDHRIVEEGTHKDLLKLGGKYAQLFEIQSKYYREGEVCEKGKEAVDLA
ncbi:MAG: ABC transporter ATP-binding protein [Clostridiaceae bacterium]|nr:ABC transporter ATP-binding protein [Clostridiaceae bacterium]